MENENGVYTIALLDEALFNFLDNKLKEEYERAGPGDDIACPLRDCGRSYKTKYSLWRHFQTHNPTRQFVCEYCSKTFSLV